MNFADHLLEDVFESDYAENAAEFIDDHGDSGAAGAEFDEEFAGELGFRDDQHFAQIRAQMEFRGRLPLLRGGRDRVGSRLYP